MGIDKKVLFMGEISELNARSNNTYYIARKHRIVIESNSSLARAENYFADALRAYSGAVEVAYTKTSSGWRLKGYAIRIRKESAKHSQRSKSKP